MSSAVSTPSIPNISPLAGLPAPKAMLIDLARLERDYFGRPDDILQAPDGSLLVSDDWAGAIYRISYAK